MEFIESKLEPWMGLEIHREKTRVVNWKSEGESLDFLGFTFRYVRSRYRRGGHSVDVAPSAQSLKRERAKLHELTSGSRRWMPIPMLIQDLNRHLEGWANSFRFGYPSDAFEKSNHYVHVRLQQHLRRRSQRRYRKPEPLSYREHFQQLGLRPLRTTVAQLPVHA